MIYIPGLFLDMKYPSYFAGYIFAGSSLETSNTPETHSARDIAANIERALRPTEGQLVIASENYAVFQSVMFEFYIFEVS